MSTTRPVDDDLSTQELTEHDTSTHGTYLDQYVEMDRQEQEAKRKARRGSPDGAEDRSPTSPTTHGQHPNTYDDDGQNVEGYGYNNNSPKENTGWNSKDPNAEAEAANASTKPSTADKLGLASAPAAVVIPAAEVRELDPSKPRTIGMTYTKEELKAGRHEFFDTPDPAFYLGAALLIGCICIFTWMADFILSHGEIKSTYLWAISCGLAGLVWLGFFLYYAITSKHHFFPRKLWDGFAGSFPCCIATFGLTWIYAFGIETIVDTASNGSKKDEFLIFGTIPLFLLVVLPTFLAMMNMQEKISQNIRNADPRYTANNYDEHPVTSSGWMYMGVMLRRIIVSWICGVCLAAHITLPAYALSWAAYGLYTLQLDKGIYVVPVIVAPPIVLLIILFIIPFTRPIVMVLWTICKQYFWYPMQNWDPREGGFWHMYDNGMTAERLVDRYNTEVRSAEKAHCDKQDAQAEAHYTNARATKELMDKHGVRFGDIDYSTGLVTDANRAPADNADAAAKAGQSTSAPDADGDMKIVA